jgi:hypothetical protein
MNKEKNELKKIQKCEGSEKFLEEKKRDVQHVSFGVFFVISFPLDCSGKKNQQEMDGWLSFGL